jgi:radical SAM superfamily enzyme YgiQ (UPF0313 family)
MPKILFIQPTQYGADKKLCKQKKIHLPGLVFPLLAAMTPDNWEVEVIIEVVDDIDYETDADIIGIGTMGYAIYRGIEIASEFRKRGKVVVMGGYMASLVSERAIQYVDSIIIGDAEISYPLLLRDFERDRKIQRIYHHPISGLDGMPLPKYELLLSKQIGNMLPVQAGRGCTQSCNFCSIATLYKGKYFTRQINEVIRDIHRVKELGFSRFYLLDDNIISNPVYLETLCKEIEPFKMTWASQCTLHLAKNTALLELVRRSGGNLMSFGIESITQEGLNKLEKSWLKVNEHKNLIRRISEAGIMVSTEMMIGTDSDTEESIRSTYDFIQENKIPIPRFYILIPTPGSVLYQSIKSENRLLTEDLKEYDGSHCVHKPENLSPERVNELYWWIYRKVFSWKSIIMRVILNPAALRSPLLHLFALAVNIHYRRYVRKRVPPNIF